MSSDKLPIEPERDNTSGLKDSGLEQLNEILNSGYMAGKTVSKIEEECKECEYIVKQEEEDL